MRNTSEDMTEVVVMAKLVDPSERQGGMRLNAEMKKEVVTKAIEHAFAKRQKVIDIEGVAIGTAAYRKCFSPATIKHATALGEPWVLVGKNHYGTATEINILQFCINGEYHNLTFPSSLPTPRHFSNEDRKYLRIKDDALAERNSTHIAAQQKLVEERNKVRATLEAMLARISTYPSLEKNWPAGKPFYKHLPTKYPFRHQVPAVLIDELNTALGI